MAPKRNNDRIDAILDSFTDEQFTTSDLSQLSDTGLKVEYLPIRLVYPDPSQPRRVLPSHIYQAFYEQRLTPVQALKEFIQIVQVTARQKGRPFSTIAELIPNPEDEDDIDPNNPTPEEQLLLDLVNLAVTIRDDGQVNPLTVVDRSQGVTRLYRIETGERRYWASWLMMEFLPGYGGDGTLPCICIPDHRASVFRQAKENTSRSGLNAIALARQAALLILAAHDIHPSDSEPISNNFYRQALELDLRRKREFTAEILTAMGGISRVHFSRFKKLLRLSDEALELADRSNLDESLLRSVLNLSEEHQEEMVRQIIDFNLTRKQLEEICSGNVEDNTPQSSISKDVKQAIKLLRSSTSAEPYEIAQGLFQQEGNIFMAKALVQKMRKVLDEVESYLVED